MGIYLRWDITNKCRMNCIHCYNADFRNKNKDVLTCEDMKLIVEKLPAEKIDILKLMGGEPLDCEYIEELSGFLNTKGIRYGITTNGDFDFNYADCIMFSKDNFSYITFSMDGYNKKEALLFRRNLNLENVISNMIQFRNKYPYKKMCLNLILNNINYSSIYDILIFYSAIGVEKINVSNLSGKSEIVSKYRCSESQLVFATKEIIRFKRKNAKIIIECAYCCNKMKMRLAEKDRDILSFDYQCLAGREIGYIDYMGNLLPCGAILNNETMYSKYIQDGNYSLLKYEFFDIWMKDAFLQVYDHDVCFRIKNLANNKSCLSCKSKGICGDCLYTDNSDE